MQEESFDKRIFKLLFQNEIKYSSRIKYSFGLQLEQIFHHELQLQYTESWSIPIDNNRYSLKISWGNKKAFQFHYKIETSTRIFNTFSSSLSNEGDVFIAGFACPIEILLEAGLSFHKNYIENASIGLTGTRLQIVPNYAIRKNPDLPEYYEIPLAKRIRCEYGLVYRLDIKKEIINRINWSFNFLSFQKGLSDIDIELDNKMVIKTGQIIKISFESKLRYNKKPEELFRMNNHLFLGIRLKM